MHNLSYIHILYICAAPAKLITPGNRDVMIGTNVVLYCKGTGKTSWFYDESIISWMNESIQEGPRDHIFLQKKRTLKIPETKLNDNGIYYCLSEEDNHNKFLDHTPLTVYGNVKQFL